jgi:hypothetical protein
MKIGKRKKFFSKKQKIQHIGLIDDFASKNVRMMTF